MTPGLPLLLLALALRRAQGNAGTSPGPPPVPPGLSCGAEVLEAVLGRLRALEGEVRALQGQCGDSLGPQAGTGSTAARRLCDTPGAGGCCGCRMGEVGDGLPCPAPRCPFDCSDQGRCRAGRCHCFEGFTGPFCATPICPPGRGGPHCTLEIPSVTLRLAARNQTSFRVTWPRPAKPVDGYEVAVIPLDEPAALTTHELPSSAVTFEVTGLTPGQAFEIFIQAQREQHLGAPGTLRVRTLLAQSLPTHGGPRRTPTFLASPVAPASPSARGSPASPRSPVSPASPGSLGTLRSPASLRSPVSPESSAAPTSLESPWSPESPVSPRSPTSPWSPASPQSPLSPASPVSPVLPNVPSLHELGVKLSSYNGSLLQRLESHLRATDFPLRGNQTVPAVARAILSYLLRRSPALLRHQFLRHLQQNPHPKPQVLPGAAGEALVDLDGLRGHAETVVIRYRLLEEPEGNEGDEGELRVPGDTTVARVPGLVPGATYRVEVHGVVRGRVSKSYTSLVTAGLGDTSEPPPEWENLYEMEGTEPQGAMAKAAPSEEEPPQRPQLGMLTVSHVTPSSIQLEWSVLEGSFDSFTVQYRDAQGQPQAIAVDGGSRTVTVQGLSPSRRYKFNLYGVWGRKRIGFISTDAVTASAKPKEEPPSPPRLGELTASHVSPDSVQLEWSVPAGSFDSFTVQYKDAQGQPQVVPVDGGSRSVTVPGLSPSRRYKFNLYGVWGPKRLGPVSTDAVTGAPGTLWVGTLWPRSAQLHWAPPHVPPDGYNLSYGPLGGPMKTLQLPPEATSKELWGLEPTGHYRVQLQGRGLEPLETTFNTPPLPHPHPRDCAEEQLNGPGPSREALIFLGGDQQRPLRVFCDMESDGGGWLVFQRRMDGGTNFWRGWEEYVHGFGNISGEFWLGNAALHTLTASGPTELRVDLRTPSDSAFARYRDFAVGGPEDSFRLHLGAYSGTAGDALSYHAGSPFSTRDHDPRGRPRPCAVAYTGAWWYRNCHYANLNGRYGVPYDHQGINWYPWKGFEYSIPFTEMKLRPQRD